MDEGFDGGADTSVDITVDTNVDTSVETSLSEGIEPVADIPVEEPVISEEIETPIHEQELSELRNEAEALEIQPLDDGVEQEQPYEPSALSNILTAGAKGASSITGTEGVYTQATRAALNMGITGSEEFMDATVRQHGKSPSVEYNEMLIQQAIDEKPEV